jgi:hypothetical protein
MKPRRPSLEIERAAAHLIRARAALNEAAHVLAALSDAPGDRLAISANVAAEQALLAEALAAAIYAPPHTALDDLVAALRGGLSETRSERH